jgi:signal transduction histidine kinase
LIDTADRVAAGDYSGRVDAGPGQLGSLAGAFNEMTDRLRTDDERRRELLADVAHELRTPLQVIRGTVEGMLDGLYPADTERLQPLLEQTIVMARLLDDLRTLSMAEAGVLELHREPVDPRALSDDAVRAFRSSADEAGITLEATTAPDAPALLEADPLRLAEILANLVANAVRHTPRGGRVDVRVSGGDRFARFEVTDTGTGIPADQLPFVFDRFVTAADTGGTGLGLSIAKRLVEAHGGTIEATAAPGGGTTIAFSIPER